MDIIYITSATATGGRESRVRSEDGIIDLEIRAPKGMGGPGGEYSNPEQIFAVGFSSCFLSAVNYVALSERRRIEASVTATVKTENNGKGGFIFAVQLDVEIQGMEQKEAEELVKMAETVCPYANSTRGNIETEVNVKATQSA